MVSEISVKTIFWGMILLATALEVIGDILFKKWSIENNSFFLITGLFIYFVGTIFWANSLKYEFLSKSISVFSILNLIVIVLVGMILFKEDLTFQNKVGIGLGIISIMLIEL